MESEAIGEMCLFAKTVGILAVLYLDLTKKINLPIFVILLFAISGFGLGFIHTFHDKKEIPIYNYHYHNIAISVLSIVVLVKKIM